MRELHAIGLTPDGQHLLLAATPDAAKPSHRIVVDKRFEAALRGQRVDDPSSGPALSVGDMQARLRAGASVEEVAAAAGVPISRVERFAGPILSEREEALRKVFDAIQVGRRGTSGVPLGRAVAIAMEDVPNARLDTVDWTAYKKADGVWVAVVSVSARGRVRRAEWSLDDAARTVRPLDAWASTLGHLDAQPRQTPEKAAAASARPAKPARSAAKAARVRPAPAKAAPAKAAPAKAVTTKAGRPTPVRTAGAKAGPAKAAPAKLGPAKAAGGARAASAAKAASPKGATKAATGKVAPTVVTPRKRAATAPTRARKTAPSAGGARRSGS